MYLLRVHIIQLLHQYFMYSRKNKYITKSSVIWLALTLAFLFDIVFSVATFPVLVMTVCGIVVAYECISPFIQSSR